MLNGERVYKHAVSVHRGLEILKNNAIDETSGEKLYELSKLVKDSIPLIKNDFKGKSEASSNEIRRLYRYVLSGLYTILSLENRQRAINKINKCIEYINLIILEC